MMSESVGMCIGSCICLSAPSRCHLACEAHWSGLDFLSSCDPLYGHSPPCASPPSFSVPAWVNTALLLIKTLLFHVFPFLPGRLPACSGFHLGSSVLPKDPGLRQLGSIWWQSSSSTCNWEWENVLSSVIHGPVLSSVFTKPFGLPLAF